MPIETLTFTVLCGLLLIALGLFSSLLLKLQAAIREISGVLLEPAPVKPVRHTDEVSKAARIGLVASGTAAILLSFGLLLAE